jgi:hypothetical protein
VEAQRLDPLRFPCVVDDERAAFDRRDVLVRMKAERDEVAARADRCAIGIAGADRERRVLDHAQAMLSRERVETVMIERREEVRRQDRPGPCVIAASAWPRSRLRVVRSQSTNTGLAPTFVIMFAAAKNVCVGVITSSPGPDSAELQRDFHRDGRRRHRAHRPSAAVVRQRLLECEDFGTARDPVAADHVGDTGDRRLVDHRTRERQERGTHGRDTSQTPTTMKPIPSQRVGPSDSPNRKYAATALTT